MRFLLCLQKYWKIIYNRFSGSSVLPDFFCKTAFHLSENVLLW